MMVLSDGCVLNQKLYCHRYKANGIRLDSGDLAYLSIQARRFFCAVEKEFGVLGFGNMTITASNDINEETLDALNKQVTFGRDVLLCRITKMMYHVDCLTSPF